MSWSRTDRRMPRIRSACSPLDIECASIIERLTASVSYGLTIKAPGRPRAAPGELRQDERPAEITAGGDELLGDEVHPVRIGRDDEGVGGSVPGCQ